MAIDTENGYDISLQQRQVWLLHQRGRIPSELAAYLLEGTLDAAALHRGVRALVERHEILRTVFRRAPGLRYPVQVIGETADLAWC